MILIETLSLFKKIPFDLYESLGEVRRARNSWLHKMKQVSVGDAGKSLTGACLLFRLVTGVGFSLGVTSQMGYSCLSYPRQAPK